jgi:hypothetical protein
LKFILGHFSLKDLNDIFFLAGSHLISQLNHFLLKNDDLVDVIPELLGLLGVSLNEVCTDNIDLVIGSDGDFINKISDGEFGTLRQDVPDMF